MKKVKLRIEAMMLSLLMLLSLCSLMPKMSASAYEPRTTAPAKDNKYYYSSINPFYPKYGLPNCTCYAYGRAYELLGYDPKLPTGNAENWYPKVAANKKGQTPKLGAIACWEGKGTEYYAGHVAVVEAINGSKITVSESNYGGELFKLRKDINPNTIFSSIDYVFQGYIYVLEDEPAIPYANIDAGTYYIKNNSTGTYLSVDSAIAADKQNVSVAAKSNSKAFQFKTTGGTEHYLYSMLDNNYVLNPYSDTPTAGTNVTLFKKVTDGTQIWGFEKATGGYIIRLKYNPNCVLAISGSNVQLATYTGAANQIWTLEKADLVLSSIKINEDSFCSIYENGSTFKPDGLTLTATYSDGSTKNITEGYTLSEVNIGTVGEATLTATYGGKTATATITINDLFEGEGTDSSPYLINTALDLENVAKMVNNPLANRCYGHASYKQTADIDLSEYTNWTPIGVYINSNSVFNGSYNGDYYKISNLNVNYDKLYTGLFGRINSASQNAVVKNLSVSGEVSGTKGCVGGIIGETGYGATIENCDFTGTVRGLTLVGGITGKIQCGATITNCYANADITATSGDAGGIVGGILVGANNYSTDAKISNSYFAGKVSGTGIGGICRPYA
ncbi:MAG: CHAP domain-containing protein [Oscillospiraceae bacterium]|nr:CHAP domain-containing protein [Oscillospiraceae bacterium]MBQ6944804.1 CHAP domain-containing protein [Ruminococcus sp.]